MGITAIRRLCQRMLVGVVVVLVVAMALGVFFVAIPKANGAEPDFNYHGPAVRVNGITLKDAEFQEIYNGVAQEASQYAMYGMPGLEEMREMALQKALNKLVVRSEIKKNKVRVPGADVDRYYNRFAKQYFPTKDEKEQFYTRNGFKNDRDFKNAIREYLEQIYLYRDLAKAKKIDVKVSQAELREAYASVTLNHILLGTQADDGGLKEEEAKKKADEVYAKVKAGEDWDKLAKQYSTDQSNKDKGGSLGEIKIKDLKASYDKDFVAAALRLKKGEFSAPVKSSFGYHLIQMVDRKEAEGPEFRNESRTIEAELIAQKFFNDKDGEKYKQWLDARTKDADVVILDPALRAYQLKAKSEWAQAAKFYEKAVRMKQHRWDREIFISALEVFSHEKMWDKAIRYGRVALERYPDDMELTAAMGKAYYQRNANKGKDRTRGLAYLRKAITLAGEDVQSLAKVKAVYEDLKLTKEVKKLETKIDKLIKEQLEEQERQQKQFEEEQKKQEEAAKAEENSAEDKNGAQQ